MGQQSVAKTTFVLVLKETTCIAMAPQVAAYRALMIVQRILIVQSTMHQTAKSLRVVIFIPVLF